VNTRLVDTLRKKFHSLSVPFNIHGVVLFGSRARDEAHQESDVDLLVVASGIPQKRQRRGKEILEIQKALVGITADILLMTPSEVESNFKNHNPLFLDIAHHGIILRDENRFLERLMQEARTYVKEKNIVKVPDGWIFPVKKGKVTYLSAISNKAFAYALLKDAKRDYEIAVTLTAHEFYDKAVYHFQQSIEKSVKSILSVLGIFRKTHFVGSILRELIEQNKVPEHWKTDLKEVADISQEIEPEVSLSRYPGIINDQLWLPFEEYSKEDATSAQNAARKVYDIAEGFLNDWFS